ALGDARRSQYALRMIAPFAGEHVDAAAALLADRHARHLAAEPLLADGDARSWVEQAWTRDGVSGAVSLHDGAVTGYLFGRVAHNDTWGTHAVIDRAGSAAVDAETTRDLYAAAAPRWLDAGARLQLANIPAVDELLDPWLRLGFGQMQLHAIRESGAPERPLPDGVTVRRAQPGDLDAAIMPMSTLIWDHQAGSPAFTGLTPPPEADVRESWAESFELPDDMLFIAELDGRPASCCSIPTIPMSALARSTSGCPRRRRCPRSAAAASARRSPSTPSAGPRPPATPPWPPTGGCPICSRRGSGRPGVSAPPSTACTACSASASRTASACRTSAPARPSTPPGRRARRPTGRRTRTRAVAAAAAGRTPPGRGQRWGRAPARSRAVRRRRPGRPARRRRSTRRPARRRQASAGCRSRRRPTPASTPGPRPPGPEAPGARARRPPPPCGRGRAASRSAGSGPARRPARRAPGTGCPPASGVRGAPARRPAIRQRRSGSARGARPTRPGSARPR